MSKVATTISQEWCTVLSLETCDPSGHFFELGGDSLLAVELTERVERRLCIDFPIETLFFDGTLAAIIAVCERRYAPCGP
jgi:acyl carrier protein